MRRYSFTNAPCCAEPWRALTQSASISSAHEFQFLSWQMVNSLSSSGFSWSLVCRHICNVLLLMNSHRYQCSVTAFSSCYLLHMHLHMNDKLPVCLHILRPAQSTGTMSHNRMTLNNASVICMRNMNILMVTLLFNKPEHILWSFQYWELFIWLNVCYVQWGIC